MGFKTKLLRKKIIRRYDPKVFWLNRHGNEPSLRSSGFTYFSNTFNLYQYKLKRIALENVISTYSINASDMRVLDIGCGSGFYVDIWRSLGVSDLVGIDITDVCIKHVSAQYPEYKFYEADITSTTLINNAPFLGQKFDIITAFDVLYHITDDVKFGQAIQNISRLCSQNGYILITDIFPKKRPYVIYFQKSRLLQDYINILEHNGIEIISRFPVHYLMHAPLDISNAVLQKIILDIWWEKIVRTVDKITHLVGPLFTKLDLYLTRRLSESPSTEMIVGKIIK